ncbi:MAG: hypothetical protein IJ981_05170 [Clostridia bacterium]|nr:hypothetical protein [Clostridia bacterium]
MKKIIAMLLAVVMVLSLCACGGGASNGGQTLKTPHDQITHVLEGKTETTYHDFVDGKCTRCEETTIFRQEPMYKSPEILFTEQAKQGTIEYFWYTTEAFCVEDRYSYETGDHSYDGKLFIKKRAFIYLPYGYDPNRAEPYNLLVMQHGNKLNEGYWFANGFYKPTDSNFTNGYGTDNMLDYMYMNEDIEDTIFVAITCYQFYGGTDSGDPENPIYTGNDTEQDNAYSGYPVPDPNNPEAGLVTDFPWYMKKGLAYEGYDTYIWKEFKYYLYPYIIENYNVYAKEATDEAMKAARMHVGFTGLSRGGWTVNSIATNLLEYVAYFAYESTVIPNNTPAAHDPDRANMERQIAGNTAWDNLVAKKDTYPVGYIFISCGTEEGPIEDDLQMMALRDALGLKEGSDIANGDSICYVTVNGTAHNYATWITNLWNLMLVFFKK